MFKEFVMRIKQKNLEQKNQKKSMLQCAFNEAKKYMRCKKKKGKRAPGEFLSKKKATKIETELSKNPLLDCRFNVPLPCRSDAPRSSNRARA